MCAEKGIAEAFYFFADDSAVIKRQNDTLIIGQKKIKLYYSKPAYQNALVNWTPDFVDVSDDGTLANSYGKSGAKRGIQQNIAVFFIPFGKNKEMATGSMSGTKFELE
jgi:hypothetical protein